MLDAVLGGPVSPYGQLAPSSSERCRGPRRLSKSWGSPLTRLCVDLNDGVSVTLAREVKWVGRHRLESQAGTCRIRKIALNNSIAPRLQSFVVMVERRSDRRFRRPEVDRLKRWQDRPNVSVEVVDQFGRVAPAHLQGNTDGR
jgi:hypothetical protein